MGEHALVEELWNVVKTSAPLLIDQGGGGQADRLRARASDYASVGELRAHIAAVCQAAKPGTPIALMARRCATALADYDTRRGAQPPPPPGRPPKHRKARADGAAPVVVTATAPAPTTSGTASSTAAGPRRTKGVRRSDAAGAVVVVAGSGVPPAKRPHNSSAAATTAAAATGGAGGSGSSSSSTGDGAAGVVRPGGHHRGGAGAPGGADAALAALAAEQFRTVVAQAGAGRETSWTARRNPLLGPAVTPDALLQALRYPAPATTGTSSTSTSSSSSASGGSGSGLGGGGGGSCSTSSRRRDVALLELQDDIAVLEDEVRRLVNARQYIKQGRVAEAHVLLARADAQRRTQRRHAQLFEAHRAALLAAVDAGAVHTPQSIYDALEIRFNNQLDIHKKHLAAAAAAAAAAATTTAAQQPQQSQQPAARAM